MPKDRLAIIRPNNRMSTSKTPTVDSTEFVSKDELLDSVRTSSVPTIVTTFDFNDPTVVFANEAHAKLTGYTASEIIGKNPRLFQGQQTDRTVVSNLKRGLHSYDSWEGTILNYTKTGQPCTVFLLIFGVSTREGERFYVAVKQKKAE